MKIREIITEVPLPSDWDEHVFSDRVDFQKQLTYALERAKDVGRGTARVAFEIQYKGRPTILKVATNYKGLAQNAAEARPEIYRKYRDIVVPLIDYDKKNLQPRWVQFEMAEPLREDNEWKQRFGGMSIEIFENIIHTIIEGKNRSMIYYYKTTYAPYMKFIDRVVELAKEYDIGHDVGTLGNWGMYKGKLVLLDLGMDSASARLY